MTTDGYFPLPVLDMICLLLRPHLVFFTFFISLFLGLADIVSLTDIFVRVAVIDQQRHLRHQCLPLSRPQRLPEAWQRLSPGNPLELTDGRWQTPGFHLGLYSSPLSMSLLLLLINALHFHLPLSYLFYYLHILASSVSFY